MSNGRLGISSLSVIIVASAAVLSYLNALPNDYCYDDVPIVRENPLVEGVGQWKTIWTIDYWRSTRAEWPSRDLLYRPVAVSSYRLVRVLGGSGAGVQHAANILLHAVVCVLILLLCRRLGFRERIALTAALIFAALPIHSEAILAIVGRADILVALFVLAALSAQASAREAGSTALRIIWHVAAVVAAFLAMGAKENGLSVFPLLLLWDALLSQRKAADLRPSWFRARALARWGCITAPLAAYLALRYHALEGELVSQPVLTKTVNVLVDAPLWQRTLGVVQAWGMYWAKTLWPRTLSINYSINAIRLATGVLDLHVVLGLIALSAVLGAGVWAVIRRRWAMVFVVAALVLCYLPTSNALSLIQTFFAERTWYVPSLWASVLLAWLVSPLLERKWAQLLGCLLLLAAGARVWWRSFDWRDNGTLFAATYKAHPDGIQPLYLYGQWLVDHERTEEGIGLLERAIAIDAGYTDAQRVLSQAYLRAHAPAKAIEHAQAAEMQVPGHAPTEQVRAEAAAELEQEKRVVLDQAYAAVVANPNDLEAHLRLARLLREVGRVEESLQIMRVNDHRFADRPTWHAEFAVNLVLLNRVDEAIARYRKSLALGENVQTAVELAMLLLERRGPGDVGEADRLSAAAMAGSADSPPVLVCRAEVLALCGDLEAAQALYRRAVQSLASDDPRRQQFIERAKALGLSIGD